MHTLQSTRVCDVRRTAIAIACPHAYAQEEAPGSFARWQTRSACSSGPHRNPPCARTFFEWDQYGMGGSFGRWGQIFRSFHDCSSSESVKNPLKMFHLQIDKDKIYTNWSMFFHLFFPFLHVVLLELFSEVVKMPCLQSLAVKPFVFAPWDSALSRPVI